MLSPTEIVTLVGGTTGLLAGVRSLVEFLRERARERAELAEKAKLEAEKEVIEERREEREDTARIEREKMLRAKSDREWADGLAATFSREVDLGKAINAIAEKMIQQRVEFETAISHMRERYERAIARCETETRGVRDELDKERKARAEDQERYGAALARIAQLEARVAELEGERSALHAQIATLAASLERHGGTIPAAVSPFLRRLNGNDRSAP